MNSKQTSVATTSIDLSETSDMNSTTFALPIIMICKGTATVSAESYEQALEKFKDDPTCADFELSDEVDDVELDCSDDEQPTNK